MLISDEPCVDINTKQEMDNTWCRDYCLDALDEVLIDVPLEACREDTYCCKQPDRQLTRLEALVSRDFDRYRPEPNVWNL